MTAPDLQAVAQVFIERMLNSAPEGMVLAGLVWALLRLMGRPNSGTRFAIWFLALLSIVALPFFAGTGSGAALSPMIASTSLHREIILSPRWADFLLVGWAIGATVLLLRLSVGLCQVHRLRNHCKPVEFASLDPAIAAILQGFGSCRRVNVCTSSEVTAPAAIGFLRPAIVFPTWLLPQLSAEEIEVILLHENAHLRRWDHWTNLAQQLVKAVFFFHPAVWWIGDRLTLEREMACDDVVLAQSASPRAYASFLIALAEKVQNPRGLALAQALLSRMRQMSLRVTQILDAKRPNRTALWKPLLAVGAVLLAVVFGAAPYVPQFVAFRNQPGRGQLHKLQAKGREPQTAAVAATEELSRAAAPSVAHGFNRTLQPTAISVAFRPRSRAVPMRLKATPQAKPVAMQAMAVQKELPSQETIVILQSTEYDASGSGVWTLCIWRVVGGKSAERQLESAIVLRI